MTAGPSVTPASVAGSDGVRHQFTTLFDYGVFDRFPDLKVVVLESGGGWIGYWLDRIDAVYGHTFIGTRVPLKHRPSDYFRERVWISCDADERSIPALAARYGADRFMWASDFPHADHTPAYIDDLAGEVGSAVQLLEHQRGDLLVDWIVLAASRTLRATSGRRAVPSRVGGAG